MAEFPSPYYTAQTATSPRGTSGGGAAHGSDVTQTREDAHLSVPVTASLTTSDFLPLLRITKPGVRVVPEEVRIRPSATSGNVTFKLQALKPDATTVDLTTAVAITNAAISFANVAVTTALPELPVGSVLRLVPTAVGTAAALTYHVELAFRVRGGS